MQNENRLRELSDSIKHNNIHIIGILEEEREKGAENLFGETIAENFVNLGKRTNSDPGGTEILQQKSTQGGP